MYNYCKYDIQIILIGIFTYVSINVPFLINHKSHSVRAIKERAISMTKPNSDEITPGIPILSNCKSLRKKIASTCAFGPFGFSYNNAEINVSDLSCRARSHGKKKTNPIFRVK